MYMAPIVDFDCRVNKQKLAGLDFKKSGSTRVPRTGFINAEEDFNPNKKDPTLESQNTVSQTTISKTSSIRPARDGKPKKPMTA